ncbi:hypothetical protein NC652_019323 [Populus alba x Populus x berolinensis]|nr:hypothetical protein NC652_019323 [Populus alba x Populus x berolinensis]
MDGALNAYPETFRSALSVLRSSFLLLLPQFSSFQMISSNSSCFRCRSVKSCWLLLQSLRFR